MTSKKKSRELTNRKLYTSVAIISLLLLIVPVLFVMDNTMDNWSELGKGDKPEATPAVAEAPDPPAPEQEQTPTIASTPTPEIGVVTLRDAVCEDIAPWGITEVGVIVAGTEVEILEENPDSILIYSERHDKNCWISKVALVQPPYIHPDDLARTLKWTTLVNRWLPYFPDTLDLELVLSIINKETKGDPHAVDQTGNDVRLVGYPSVGVMAAIIRPHLPCYETLSGPNGRDEYSCQIYLGMFILDYAIKRAYEIRTGIDITDPVIIEAVATRDVQCYRRAGEPAVVRWFRAGTKVTGVEYIHSSSGKLSYLRVSEDMSSHGCWVALDYLDQVTLLPDPTKEPLNITQEDVELGIKLYGCTEHNVLEDNCLEWGGETYVRAVIDNILPEIKAALGK